jgi:hypothetical protein
MTMTETVAAAPAPAPVAVAAAVPAHLDFLQQIEADGEAAVAKVKAGLTFLDKEAKIGVAWVEKEVPGSAGAIAAFFTAADTEAASLAAKAANGLGDEIKAGGDDMETFMANLIQALGLGTDETGKLKALDASGIALVESIGKSLVSTSLASIIAKLAPVAIAAVI